MLKVEEFSPGKSNEKKDEKKEETVIADNNMLNPKHTLKNSNNMMVTEDSINWTSDNTNNHFRRKKTMHKG